MITIKPITVCSKALIALVKQFKHTLSALNQTKPPTYEAAKQEAKTYFQENRYLLGAYKKDTLVGFIVLKTVDDVYWVDWLYVDKQRRREGIASTLFKSAEAYAQKQGEDKLYIWVHPDNETMLKFLSQQGYDALNLIEVTKKRRTKGKKVTFFNQSLKY